MGSKPGGAENNSDCNDENVKKNGMNHYNIKTLGNQLGKI
jgi:hypothetical protein